jgi:peptidoglycan/LPS O-acetylase OafA/YrhL
MSETTRPQSRLAWLDALRGFAALCVVFDHGSTLLLLPARSFLYQWLNLGQYGVFVFFLVSGYIVPASLERKGSIRGFWIGRAFRLYPMFLVALVLSAVAYEAGYGSIANAGKHPLAALLGWLFMLQNLVAGLNVPVVIWTLSYEMVFYLLLAALFAWGVHRRSGWYATAFAVGAVALGGIIPMSALGHWTNAASNTPLVLNASVDALVLIGLALSLSSRSSAAKVGTSLAALVALVLVTFNQSYPYPWSGCTILALMFTGTLIYRVWGGDPPAPPGMGGLRPPISPPREDAQKPRAPRAVAGVKALWFGGKAPQRAQRLSALVVVLLIFALLTFAGTWHGAQEHHDAHWQLQWATSVLLAGATFGIGLLVRRWRVPRWCAWLGMISYSVYLLHPLIFDAYRDVPALHRPHTLPDQVLIFACILAVVIGLSALTYYGVEKPMQRLGRRVAARFPSPGQPTGSGPQPAEAALVATPASAEVPDASAEAPDGSTGAPGKPASGEPTAASRSASSSTVVAGGSGGSP